MACPMPWKHATQFLIEIGLNIFIKLFQLPLYLQS